MSPRDNFAWTLAYLLSVAIVTFTPEEIERFKTDDEFYRNYRFEMEDMMNVRLSFPTALSQRS